jgi:hypothetical protein
MPGLICLYRYAVQEDIREVYSQKFNRRRLKNEKISYDLEFEFGTYAR